MAYVKTQDIVNNFRFLFEKDQRLNTFLGLICLFSNSEKESYNYIKSDMINFAKEMDSAFYLNTNLPERTGTKFWYTLFQSDWILGVKETLLKNKQISAKKIALSLYWYKSFNDSDELVKYFKSRFSNEEAYESFFFETDSDIIFSEATKYP